MKPIRRVRRAYHQANRMRHIATILVKYGLTDYVRILRLDKGFSLARKILLRGQKWDYARFSRYKRIRMAIEELGVTFIKLGQLLSNRTDMLPPAMLDELAQLQDRVPPIKAERVRRIVESELGKPLDQVFARFEETPIASASIAQVNYARLPDGKEVAVKVQRPGIQEVVDVDLEILFGLAGLIERYLPGSRLYQPREIVKQFRAQLKTEINFNRELLHMQKFAALFRRSRTIRVPLVVRDLTTRRVLTMEYIDGTKVSRITERDGSGFNKRVIAHRGATLILEQIFMHGFFHADPHPGNILVLPGNIICFLDFGMMGRIRPREQESLRQMFLGMTSRDAEQTAKAILSITRRTTPVNMDEFEMRVYDLLDEYLDLSLEDFDLPGLFVDLTALIRSFGLIISPNLMLMIKALIAVQAIGVDLDPTFNLIRLFEPFARRLIAQEFRPGKLGHETFQTAMNYKELLEELPIDARTLIDMAKKGKFSVELRVRGLDRFRRTLDRIGYRLVHGAVLAALIIGSSFVMSSNLLPQWHGVSVIGLVGFSIAMVMGLGVIAGLVFRFFRR